MECDKNERFFWPPKPPEQVLFGWEFRATSVQENPVVCPAYSPAAPSPPGGNWPQPEPHGGTPAAPNHSLTAGRNQITCQRIGKPFVTSSTPPPTHTHTF